MKLIDRIFGRARETATTAEALMRRAGRAIRARYDAAETNDVNKRHWAHAIGLSADAAANPHTRFILRNRARYEAANNSYARGIVATLGNETIGTGPRLQMNLDSSEANREIEREFARWAKAVDLPRKLRLMRRAKAESGEVFCVLTSNPKLPTRVKLDLKLVEADQVTSPRMGLLGERGVDGIRYDAHGNPTEYHILKRHPGDLHGFSKEPANLHDIERVPADEVIHYFNAERPGQSRGVPELTPALPLFAQLRRYTLAVIGSAEIAANWAGILYTEATAETDEEAEPFDPIELEPRALLTVPAGYRMEQLKSEQPTTTHDMFVRAILTEIARCLNMPYSVAAGDSSEHNYASGRLDHQGWHRSLHVERRDISCNILDRVVGAWAHEAVLISDYLSLTARTALGKTDREGSPILPDHSWFWDGFEHVDAAKEANAQETRLRSGTTNLSIECAKQGLDWEEVLTQRARELEFARKHDIPIGETAKAPAGESADRDADESPSRSRRGGRR